MEGGGGRRHGNKGNTHGTGLIPGQSRGVETGRWDKGNDGGRGIEDPPFMTTTEETH